MDSTPFYGERGPIPFFLGRKSSVCKKRLWTKWFYILSQPLFLQCVMEGSVGRLARGEGLAISGALTDGVKNLIFADQNPCQGASSKRSAFSSFVRLH